MKEVRIGKYRITLSDNNSLVLCNFIRKLMIISFYFFLTVRF